MHDWNEGKISRERSQLAGFINGMQTSIQQTLLFHFAEASEPGVTDEKLAEGYTLLRKYEKDLWTASKTPVRAIMQSSSTIFDLLRQSPRQDGDVVVDIMGLARVVDDALQTLTTLQSRTMLTVPKVALAQRIAVDTKVHQTICSQRYQWWVEQAHNVERGYAESERCREEMEGGDLA